MLRLRRLPSLAASAQALSSALVIVVVCALCSGLFELARLVLGAEPAGSPRGTGVWSAIAAAILFLRWFSLATENAHSMDPTRCEFFARGAVAAFLLPGVNLVLPLTIAKRIWRATAYAAARGAASIDGVTRIVPAELRSRAESDWPSNELVSVWWCWFLTMIFAHTAAGVLFGGAYGVLAGVGADLATAGAGIAALRMVRRITELQTVCLGAPNAA